MAPLLKICGLTTIADLRLAQRVGADFLGIVVESNRPPRSLPLERAIMLARAAKGRPTGPWEGSVGKVVAVTLCDDLARLREIVAAMKPRALQLHSPHALQWAAELRGEVPVWVAVGVPPEAQDAEAALTTALAEIAQAAAAGAEMIVLDTSVKGETGGTGQTSDWALVARLVAQSPLPVLLAGGIGAENAAAALAQVRPAGLDSSSRTQSAPGRKDARKVRDLAKVVKG